MNVFVTGATGWIGRAVVPELLEHGHAVVALARTDAGAGAVAAAGARPLQGSLEDLDLLGRAAADSDGVVHLAFRHDLAFSGDYPAAAAADRAAITALGAPLGDGRPLVIASGLAGFAPGREVVESDQPSGERGRCEVLALGLAGSGVRASSVRLAPTVHGDGDGGFLASLVATARRTGVAGYLGDGTQRWPAVHRSDAARLFRLALEAAPAGAVLHGAAEPGVAQSEIAAVLGRHLGLPVAPVAAADGDEHFGWLAAFLASDVHASSARTRDLLGWEPTGPGLLEDLEQGHYFAPVGVA